MPASIRILLYILSSGLLIGQSAAMCPALTPASSTTVELSETEVKYLVSDLTKIPSDLLQALKTGASHPQILRRGFVIQEYLTVSEDNLRTFFEALNAARIPFGSLNVQNEFLSPGVAQELRMMSKTIKIGDKPTTILQAAVKASGTISVSQIESPETLNFDQYQELEKIFRHFRGAVQASVRKVYFEFFLSGADGPSVELDIFLGAKGFLEAPLFVNGEIEFHGVTVEAAVSAAQGWQSQPRNVPPFFALDITQVKGVKSRDIAFRGPPEYISVALAPFAVSNRELVLAIAREFGRWSDPTVLGLFPGLTLLTFGRVNTDDVKTD